MANGWHYTWRLFSTVLPQVRSELQHWQRQAAAIPVAALRRQALDSLRYKRFHCEGGSVFACQFPQADPDLVKGIVALQTLSDYLDNLVDRWRPGDEETAQRLHRSFYHALHPGSRPGSYFTADGPDDGGYAQQLVTTVQQCCQRRPAYNVVLPLIRQLATDYCRLQVLKHGPLARRQKKLENWLTGSRRFQGHGLHWFEYAAATGSTLAIFALLGSAGEQRLTYAQAQSVAQAYFPWICSLHILLDYWIDQEEDRLAGDFNFAACYENNHQARRRLEFLLNGALDHARRLPNPGFHTLLVQGLPGLYLADDKVVAQRLQTDAGHLLRAAGPRAQLVHRISRWRRRLQGEASLLQPPPEESGVY